MYIKNDLSKKKDTFIEAAARATKSIRLKEEEKQEETPKQG